MSTRRSVILDTSPAGLICNSRKSPESIACNRWLRDVLNGGNAVYLPAIVDYELRREFIRAKLTSSLDMLDELRGSVQFIPISQQAFERASELWARCRQQGLVTADPHALDGDVILVAQVELLLLGELVVATTNHRHIGHFLPAMNWQDIT